MLTWMVFDLLPVVGPQLRHQVARVLGSVYNQGLGDDQEKLGKVSNGQLLLDGEGGGEVLRVDGEGGLDTPTSNHNRLAFQDSLDNRERHGQSAPSRRGKSHWVLSG